MLFQLKKHVSASLRKSFEEMELYIFEHQLKDIITENPFTWFNRLITDNMVNRRDKAYLVNVSFFKVYVNCSQYKNISMNLVLLEMLIVFYCNHTSY